MTNKIYKYEKELVLQAIRDKKTFRFKDIQKKVSINPLRLKFILYTLKQDGKIKKWGGKTSVWINCNGGKNAK